MGAERIIVSGPLHRASLIGAVLTARWAGAGREVVIATDDELATGAKILARPGHQRLHAEIGLPEEAVMKQCAAQPVFAIEVATAEGSATLPFSPIGIARGGVEFHHFWARANALGLQPDLFEFSPAVSLNAVAAQVAPAMLARLQLPFGLALDAVAYCDLLIRLVRSSGGLIVAPAEAMEADLIVDCGLVEGSAGWSGRTLKVATDRDLPALEWQICANAVRRLLGLTSELKTSEHEQREYTRLALAEAERIADMRALLQTADPRETTRPALRRKVDLFTACGRITCEDFEFFTPPEWLAALWARGMRPRRFDRMAQAMPAHQLQQWMATVHGQVRQLSSAGAVA